jgi:rSAM/selenodomain-associated transferase 2
MTDGAAGLADVSVVVPVLNGAWMIGATLASVGAVGELIVCDGGSSDDSVAIAEKAGARVVHGSRGRGVQLAAGAAASTRPWMLFLHADTRLDDACRRAVAEHIARPGSAAQAGVFRLSFDDDAWQARALERAVAMRVRLFALPYGDQGLLIHRDLYDAIGGFRPLPLMEDVDIVRRLGRRRIARLPAAVVTSAEKWRRRGWVRQSAGNLMCLGLYLAGMPVERVAKLYGR